MRVGRTIENTLKWGATKKRGGQAKILKRGQAGSRDGCLKEKGDWNSLTNYVSNKRKNMKEKTKKV